MANNVFINEPLVNEVVRDCYLNNKLIPSFCFINNNGKREYTEQKYFIDKERYLIDKKWPEVGASYRDSVWAYYYYLLISDHSINLDKYLDFDYDTTKWTRDKLKELINKYGKSILFAFGVYSTSKTDLLFDEWYENEKEFVYSLSDEYFISGYKTIR